MSKTDPDDVRGITSPKGLTRRSLIVRAGGTLAAVSGAGSILAACGGGSSETTTSASAPAAGQAKGIGGIPIASKQHPVKRVCPTKCVSSVVMRSRCRDAAAA